MLVDVKIMNNTDPVMSSVLAVIADLNGNTGTKRLATGVYEIGHFSFDHLVNLNWPRYEDNYPNLTDMHMEPFNSFGVCDEYGQVIGHCADLSPSVRWPYVLSVTPIRRSQQSAEGGWRWHKWGPYIGTQKPTTEYIYDEPLIEKVYVYHIYKVPTRCIDFNSPQLRAHMKIWEA